MSLTIKLNQVGKRYKYEWIIKNVNLELLPGHSYAVTGPNGSGKSTLLQILSGYLTPSKGKVQFLQSQKELDINSIYKDLSYAAPYIELVEELTLTEMITFHFQFKKAQQQISTKEMIDLLGMKSSRHKAIKNFSSGMKQRLKLALAICSKTDLLLLDEPTSNLDQQGVEWYLSLMEKYTADRLMVVASNVEVDFQFCKEKISILDYK
ncbi:MAG: ABC transporter ATP-binding protein [Bacteroidota bacterium]